MTMITIGSIYVACSLIVYFAMCVEIFACARALHRQVMQYKKVRPPLLVILFSLKTHTHIIYINVKHTL